MILEYIVSILIIALIRFWVILIMVTKNVYTMSDALKIIMFTMTVLNYLTLLVHLSFKKHLNLFNIYIYLILRSYRNFYFELGCCSLYDKMFYLVFRSVKKSKVTSSKWLISLHITIKGRQHYILSVFCFIVLGVNLK